MHSLDNSKSPAPTFATADATTTGGSTLTYTEIRDVAAAPGLVREWEALAEACAATTFARPDYALSWWSNLGKGRLLIAVVRRGDDLVALAPLHERRVGPVWAARWLGHGIGTIAQILVAPGHEEAAKLLWQGLAKRRRVLELVETRAGGPGIDALTEFGGHPGRTLTTTVHDCCPTTEVSGDGLDVVRREGNKNLRRALTVADKRTAADGHTFSFMVAQDAAALEAALPDVRRIFDAAEEANPRLHFLQPPYEDFTLDFLRGSVPRGEAAVFVGYLDERPVCFNITLLSPTTLSILIPRFDPDVSRFNPGHLLTRAIFGWTAEQGRTCVDQLLGMSQYKRQWATDSYETLEIVCGTPAAIAVTRQAVRVADRAHRVLDRIRS